MVRADAVIVSAGKGERFGGKKKQFLLLDKKPILAHSLDKFESSPLICSIILVVSQDDLDYCLKEIVEKFQYRKISHVVPGGKRRQDSVKNGIDNLPRDTEILVIHDGVRPFVTRVMIEDSIQSAIRYGAVVTAIPVKDTIKMANPDGTVLKTFNRETLWQAQTPQSFRIEIIREAYQRAIEEGFTGTDDASLVERLGINVHIILGSYNNIKITTPEDLALANLLIKKDLLMEGS